MCREHCVCVCMSVCIGPVPTWMHVCAQCVCMHTAALNRLSFLDLAEN